MIQYCGLWIPALKMDIVEKLCRIGSVMSVSKKNMQHIRCANSGMKRT